MCLLFSSRKAVGPFVSFVLSVSVFTSCYQAEDTSWSDSTSDVMFSFNADGIEKQSQTRALTAPTNLLIVDSCGGKVTSKELTSLEDVDLSLDYGEHSLYFVAAVAKWSSFNTSSLTVEWSKSELRSLKCVWGCRLSLTVDANTGQQNVNLPLLSGMLKVTSLDKCPTNASSIVIDAPQLCHGLDLSTMQGYHIDNSVETDTVALTSSAADRTLNLGLYSLVPSSGSIGDISLSPYSSSNTEINCVTLNEVPIQAGYVSSYTGYLFTNGIATTITYTTDWLGTTEYKF